MLFCFESFFFRFIQIIKMDTINLKSKEKLFGMESASSSFVWICQILQSKVSEF